MADCDSECIRHQDRERQNEWMNIGILVCQLEAYQPGGVLDQSVSESCLENILATLPDITLPYPDIPSRLSCGINTFAFIFKNIPFFCSKRNFNC